MRYPKFLPENGTIGFVAPSFGCNMEPYRSAFDNAQKKFRKMGYGVSLGPNCYAGDGIGISSSPENCGRELTEFYCSEKNDVLISCGGGELMCEDLDYVDFDRVRKADPKWYLGYSDNTNFTFLLATLCDTAAVYGPCAAAFGMEPWHPAIRDAFDVLCGKKLVQTGYARWEKESKKDEEHPTAPYNVTEPRVLRGYIPGWKGNAEEKGSLLVGKQTAEAASLTEEGKGAWKTAGEDSADFWKKAEGKIAGKAAAAKPAGSDQSAACEAGENMEKTFFTEGSPAGQYTFESGAYILDRKSPEIHMEGRLIGGCLDVLCMLAGTKYDHVKEFAERYRDDGLIWFLESCDLNVMGIRRALWQLSHAGWFAHAEGFLIGRPLCFGQELMGLDQYGAVTGALGGYGVPIVMDADFGHLPPAMPLISGSLAEVTVKGQKMKVKMELK